MRRNFHIFNHLSQKMRLYFCFEIAMHIKNSLLDIYTVNTVVECSFYSPVFFIHSSFTSTNITDPDCCFYNLN